MRRILYLMFMATFLAQAVVSASARDAQSLNRSRPSKTIFVVDECDINSNELKAQQGVDIVKAGTKIGLELTATRCTENSTGHYGDQNATVWDHEYLFEAKVLNQVLTERGTPIKVGTRFFGKCVNYINGTVQYSFEGIREPDSPFGHVTSISASFDHYEKTFPLFRDGNLQFTTLQDSCTFAALPASPLEPLEPFRDSFNFRLGDIFTIKLDKPVEIPRKIAEPFKHVISGAELAVVEEVH